MTTRRFLFAAIALAALGACATVDSETVSAALTPASGHDMQTGELLEPGDSLSSKNGAFTLKFQADGDLVLYRNSDSWPLWALGSEAVDGFLLVQGDGNLVMYSPEVEWESETGGHPGAALFVQNDGNVVLYSSTWEPLWDTGTDQTGLPTGPRATGDDMLIGETLRPGEYIFSGNKKYAFGHRMTGNLVLFRMEGLVKLWQSYTFDPGGVATLRADGNLAIYSPGLVWASDHPGDMNAHLLVQNDGNVVIYSPTWEPLWDTGTGEP